ncbi:hypothetical protein G2912_26165 [Paraburkholderia aspalathi]|uniref:Uncharacterized protein n=1 Tax=Paraburkholderia nemoris TaxID=2793076 RepID=A0ABM8SDK9_9BURK|nr:MULTISPECIES: hypothetical protein [Paraburkholderia]MBK3813850.1 hypothetical protein [Paraburkholderia aspalathi]CAE6803161.1 hypothetical protein R69776_05310 [Paraburkholderia nemoris]
MSKKFQLRQHTENAVIRWGNANRQIEVCELLHRESLDLYRRGLVDATAIVRAATDVQQARDRERAAWGDAMVSKDAWLAEAARFVELRKARPRRAAIARRLWLLRAKRQTQTGMTI